MNGETPYKEFEVVVLIKDIEEYGLRSGDTGTIVGMYEPDAIDVEFLTGARTAYAVLGLLETDVRHLSSKDILTVRAIDDVRNS